MTAVNAKRVECYAYGILQNTSAQHCPGLVTAVLARNDTRAHLRCRRIQELIVGISTLLLSTRLFRNQFSRREFARS